MISAPMSSVISALMSSSFRSKCNVPIRNLSCCLQEALSLRKIFRPLVQRGEMNGYPVLLLGSLRAGPKALWDYARGTR